MANWASTAYAIEGPKETLQKIFEAILKTEDNEDGERWETRVLQNLIPDYEEIEAYTRGGILDESWYFDKNTGALRFSAGEAWGVTDFNQVLENHFPDIKVYYSVEEQNEEVYATNDKEGKYFPERYYADICIDGIYFSEYFTKENSLYKWLMERTNSRVSNKKEIELFNAYYEDSCEEDDNFIHVYEFTVID